MTENYRRLLITILMVGMWLCGSLFGYGVGALSEDVVEGTRVSPYIIFCVLGVASTFLFTLFIVIGKLYPELCRTIDKDQS